MSKAVTELERLSRDPEARMVIDTVERDRRFHEYEVRVGQEAARAEGREEGRLELARTLVARGLPLAEVAQLTGFPVERLAAVDP
jgi:predicted transposase/invertase (TIGR01784 family)